MSEIGKVPPFLALRHSGTDNFVDNLLTTQGRGLQILPGHCSYCSFNTIGTTLSIL